MLAHTFAVSVGETPDGVDLHRDARERLREGIVQLDGEACALVDLEVRDGAIDLFIGELPAAPFREPPERRVPHEDRRQDEHERADDGCRRAADDGVSGGSGTAPRFET